MKAPPFRYHRPSTIAEAVESIAAMDCMLVRPLCLQMLEIEDKAE